MGNSQLPLPDSAGTRVKWEERDRVERADQQGVTGGRDTKYSNCPMTPLPKVRTAKILQYVPSKMALEREVCKCFIDQRKEKENWGANNENEND